MLMTMLLLVYLALAQLSDLVAASVYAGTGWEGIGAIQYVRDGLAAVLFVLGYRRSDIPPTLRWSAAGYLAIIAIYILAGTGSDLGTSLVIRSAAKLAVPVVILFAAYACAENMKSLRIVLGAIVGLAAASALFGRWDIGHTEFWTDTIDYGGYLVDVKQVSEGYRSDTLLPFNFFGYDDVRRAGGLVAAPLAQGSFLALAAVVGFGAVRVKRPVAAAAVLALLAYGVYQSGTRGALVMLIVALPLQLFLGSRRLGVFGRDAILIAAGLALSFGTLSSIYGYSTALSDGSTVGHLWSLEENLQDLGGVLFVGGGLGRAGALAADAGLDVAGGGEGALFSVLYQLGGPGGIAFLWFYGAVLVELYRRCRQPGVSGEVAAATCAFGVAAISTMVVSEHLLTVSGMAPFWIAAGGILRAVPASAKPVPAPMGEASSQPA